VERGQEGEYRAKTVYTCTHAKMIPVETIPGYIVRTFVSAAMYPTQHN
jgi:hypothetical protein